MHPTRLALDELAKQCVVRTQRRSGPGGQHRNKVETGAFVQHKPTGIEAAATEERSQAQNRAVALDRLRVKLAIEYRTPRSAGERPVSELWKSRCRGGRISVNRQHFDFAALLSEALDILAHHKWDYASAAQQLACSTTQLVKLLSVEHEALSLVNDQRSQRGLPGLPAR